VRTSQVALVTTFGNPARAITEPGAYYKWPWPIQRVHKFDKRIQNFEDKLDESPTSDSPTLLSQMYVGWQITDPAAFYPRFASGLISEPERASITAAERSLEGLLRTHKTAVIGRHPLADLVNTDPNQLKFDAIESEILAAMSAQLKTNNYGIDVKYVGFKKLGYPESVTEEVFKRMTSERNVLISNTKYAGQSAAAKIKTDADSKSAIMLADANAQATKLIGEGQANAAKSFEVFRQNPELENFLLDLNNLDQLLKSRPTLILDDRSSPFNLFKGASTNLNTKK
jgi:membrane protease subunit HflC